MTIIDFLLARIAEDEARAREREDAMIRVAEKWHTLSDNVRAIIDVRGTRRALAECQAKRAIIEEHRHEVGYVVAYRESDRLIAEGYDLDTVPLQASAAMVPTCIRHLAAVYSDHPDYQQEWEAMSCTHDEWVDDARLCDPYLVRTCNHCGATVREAIPAYDDPEWRADTN